MLQEAHRRFLWIRISFIFNNASVIRSCYTSLANRRSNQVIVWSYCTTRVVWEHIFLDQWILQLWFQPFTNRSTRLAWSLGTVQCAELSECDSDTERHGAQLSTPVAVLNQSSRKFCLWIRCAAARISPSAGRCCPSAAFARGDEPVYLRSLCTVSSVPHCAILRCGYICRIYTTAALNSNCRNSIRNSCRHILHLQTC